jgi:hypothetical protein
MTLVKGPNTNQCLQTFILAVPFLPPLLFRNSSNSPYNRRSGQTWIHPKSEISQNRWNDILTLPTDKLQSLTSRSPKMVAVL